MASYELTNHPDIQGLLFRGYPGLGQAAYGMFQIKDREAFQRWMQQAIEDYAFATASDGQVRRDETSRMNIGLTASGVQKLVGDGFIADTFEPAFIDGMVKSIVAGDWAMLRSMTRNIGGGGIRVTLMAC